MSTSTTFGTPGLIAAYVDSEMIDISWNIAFENGILEMTVNDNGVLFATITRTTVSFELYAINITNGERL